MHSELSPSQQNDKRYFAEFAQSFILGRGSEFGMKYHVLHDFITSTSFEEKSSDHSKDRHKMEPLTNFDISLTSLLGGVMN